MHDINNDLLNIICLFCFTTYNKENVICLVPVGKLLFGFESVVFLVKMEQLCTSYITLYGCYVMDVLVKLFFGFEQLSYVGGIGGKSIFIYLVEKEQQLVSQSVVCLGRYSKLVSRLHLRSPDTDLLLSLLQSGFIEFYKKKVNRISIQAVS